MPDGSVTDQEIANMQHMLDLLKKQIHSHYIEEDYAIRQIDKVKDLITRLAVAQKEQKAEGRFEVLYNVTRMMGTSLDLQIVLDQVMDAVIKLTGAERGFLMLRDDDGNLKLKAGRNLDQQTINSSDFEYSRTISNHVLDQGEAVLTTNAVEDPRFRGRASIMMQSLRSIMATPLWARGRIIGITYVENRVVAGMFDDEALATLETLAGQASIAIDNALLFAETDDALSRRVEELSELRRIDMQLNEKLDPDEAMYFTLETAGRICNATSGHLGLVEGNPPRIIARHHYYAENGQQDDGALLIVDDVYPQAWEAIQQQETVTFDTGQYGLRTVLIVPIVREKKAIGVMVLKQDTGDHFSEEQRDQVERVVTRAAITIENARLYAEVQAADRAKSEFVGTVAHDLKAPMTSIQGYADLMLMNGDQLSPNQTKFLSRISNTVKHMERLVSDLSDVSRIESGQFLMDELRYSTASVVEAVRDVVAPQMQERKHTFNVEMEDALPDLWTDYYRLVQVLTNLLTNAYKYTPDGGTITLWVRHEAGRVFFTVQDTGIGLSQEQVSMLGTKFWRAEDEYTRKQQGTGLGFSITLSLVEQMGSKIRIESEPGVGSTFSFSVSAINDTGNGPAQRKE